MPAAPSYWVDDPDAAVIYPVTDSQGGDTDWADPTVVVAGTTIAAEWLGDPAPTRNLRVPLTTLPLGMHVLWLQVPGANDIKLGTVWIVEPQTYDQPDVADCLWPMDPACFDTQWEGLDPGTQIRARVLASRTLERLTAGRVGVCPITVRPSQRRGGCYQPSDPFMYPGTYHPYLWNGQWFNCAQTASPCEVALPAPVGRIDEVKIDGAVLDPADYSVQNGRYLVWRGTGPCPWPADQDVTLSDTEVGTFSVTYLNAYPVDAVGAYAAGVLAMEYGKACAGDRKCRLPAGTTSIVRQGISFEVVSGAFPDGLTGIREIDSFITLWNPRGATEAARVWSPGKSTRVETL